MGQALPIAGGAASMEWIEVSPEMTALIGHGSRAGVPLPSDPVWLVFGFDPATVRIADGPDEDHGETRLQFAVARSALLRMGGREPIGQDGRGYHLPTELRAIALALRDCAMIDEPRNVYRLAKSLELFCETIRLQRGAGLVPLAEDGAWSIADSRRLVDAKRMIDERWREKLTLDAIARGCGLNRAKLTRGFREMFACTIAEALAERRLRQASRMLLTTDLPVSSIGYENGYLNNASFARAFGRRFGLTPTGYRACGVVA